MWRRQRSEVIKSVDYCADVLTGRITGFARPRIRRLFHKIQNGKQKKTLKNKSL